MNLPLDDDGAGRRAYWSRRHATLQPIVDRARARGESPPAIEDVIEHVLAPLYFRRFVSGRAEDDHHVTELIDDLVARCATHSERASR